MSYSIKTFVGDYPVKDQPFWGKVYDNFAIAIADASQQHYLLKEKWHDAHYTMVMEVSRGDDESVWFIIYRGQAIVEPVRAAELADRLSREIPSR